MKNKKIQGRPAYPAWMRNADRYDKVLSIFRDLANLSCFLVGRDFHAGWRCIHQNPNSMTIIDIERQFGKAEARMENNHAQFRRVLEKKDVVVSHFDGFWGAFVPVMVRGRCEAILTSGPFLKHPPKVEEVNAVWRGMAGGDLQFYDHRFSTFLKTFLETPVLEGVAFKAYLEFLGLLAGTISDETDIASASRRIQALRERVFASNIPYRMWGVTAEAVHPYFRGNLKWPQPDLRREFKADFGISRIPSVAVAVMLSDPPGAQQHEVEMLVRARQFQQECFYLSRRLPETLSGRLDWYGAVFLTSCDADKGLVQWKLEMRDYVKAIGVNFQSKFKSQVNVGIGKFYPRGEGLPESFNEAVWALHEAAKTGKRLVFYDEGSVRRDDKNPFELHAMAKQLVEVTSNASGHQLDLVLNTYIQEIFFRSGQRIEFIKLHFIQVLHQMYYSLKQRAMLDARNLEDLFGDLIQQVEGSFSVPDLFFLFRKIFKDLAGLVTSPGAGNNAVKLLWARRHIEENFGHQLKLRDVARTVGFSPTYFSHLFKKSLGIGFEAFLLELRVTKAQQLLRMTQLPLAQVGQEAGFSSYHYFYNAFRKKNDLTPMQYRRRAQGNPS